MDHFTIWCDSALFTEYLVANSETPESLRWQLELTKLIFEIVGIIAAAYLFGWKSLWAFHGWLQRTRLAKQLKRQKLQGHYDSSLIDRALRDYIWPKCSSSVDPSHFDEPRLSAFATKESLRSKMDEFLDDSNYSHKHLLILGDSGTGKTSFLLNYFAHNLGKWWSPKSIQLIHLGSEDCDLRIDQVDNPSETTLFLDALDEDPKAIRLGFERRITDLIFSCRRFARVVITCRTQFIPKEEEIPSKTGVAKLGPRAAGESAVFEFIKYYLAPLDDREVARYVRRKFPIWNLRRRTKALDFVSNLAPQLSCRPMLLSHLSDLIDCERKIGTIFELYDALLDAWYVREDYWIGKHKLKAFSEMLAVKLFSNPEEYPGARITAEQIKTLGREAEFDCNWNALTSRSLLNRDSEDCYKFSHRSILEFLFVSSMLKGHTLQHEVPLTDLASTFYDSHFLGRDRDRTLGIACACGTSSSLVEVDAVLTVVDDTAYLEVFSDDDCPVQGIDERKTPVIFATGASAKLSIEMDKTKLLHSESLEISNAAFKTLLDEPWYTEESDPHPSNSRWVKLYIKGNRVKASNPIFSFPGCCDVKLLLPSADPNELPKMVFLPGGFVLYSSSKTGNVRIVGPNSWSIKTDGIAKMRIPDYF